MGRKKRNISRCSVLYHGALQLYIIKCCAKHSSS